MAGGDELGADAVGVVEQLAELDPVVALHAGIRRAPGRVLVDEVVDDLPELVLQIERVERDAELVGHAAGVVGVGARCSSLACGRGGTMELSDAERACRRLAPAAGSSLHATGDCSPWRMKTPITSWPCSTSRWAATLESTPPVMASTMRDILAESRPAAGAAARMPSSRRQSTPL